MADIGVDTTGVGGQITDYAKQVATLNQQIDALSKAGLPPADDIGKTRYQTLKQQRDALVSKATDLVGRTKKAGAEAPDFTGEVKKQYQALRAPKQNQTVAATTSADTPDPAAKKPGLTLADVRTKYPQYQDMPDDKLADALHSKFYRDMPRDEFNKKIGYTPSLPESLGPRSPAGITEAQREAAKGRLAAVEGPPAAAGTQSEIFKRKEELEKQLQAQGKNPADDPQWRELSRQLAQSVSAGATQTALATAALDLTPAGEAIGKAFKAGYRGAKGLAKRAIGTEARQATEALRGEATKRAGEVAGTEEAAAKEAAEKARRLEETQRAVRTAQPEIAAQRAARAAAPTPAPQARQFGAAGLRPAVKTKEGIKIGKLGDNHDTIVPNAPESTRGFVDEKGKFLTREQAGLKAQTAGLDTPTRLHSEDLNRVEGLPARAKVGPEAERGAVAERTAARARELEEEYKQAGLTAEQAQKQATEQATRVQDAETAVDKLEKDLLAKPGATAEQFGTEIRKTTQELNDKYASARAREAGFDSALKSAGDELRVDTTGARKLIDDALKDIRNPSLQRVLEGMKGLLTTSKEGAEGEVAHEALTVRAADSLRKYLDGVIQSKTFGDQAIDKETLYFIKNLKRELVKSATEGWKPYRDALAKWRTLSRPLDIVERKGALRKVIETDPVSTDYALTEAQVVGRVIQQARAGNPTFTRLLAERPELRDSARLYFTQDLFGKGAVPTEASMRTWLKTNETPLRQLGLYDEFRNVRIARETAQRAVDEAKDTAKETLAQARAAEKQEAEVKRQLGRAQKVRELARKRAGEARAARPSAEDLRSEAAKRAEKGETRLKEARGEARGVEEKRVKAADAYRQFETEIGAAVDKKVPTVARNFVKKLRDDQRIDDNTYKDLLKKIDDVEAKTKSVEQLRQRLKRIGLVAASAGGSYYLYRDIRNLLGL